MLRKQTAADSSDISISKGLIGFGESRRRLLILKTEEICRDKCPMGMNKLISSVAYVTGCSDKNIKSILQVLYDTDIINIKDNVISIKDGKK